MEGIHTHIQLITLMEGIHAHIQLTILMEGIHTHIQLPSMKILMCFRSESNRGQYGQGVDKESC